MYFREIWYYKDANTELMRQEIIHSTGKRVFFNPSMNKKIHIFNKTIVIVISNFVSYETVYCDDKYCLITK